jgi:hypothetical protein
MGRNVNRWEERLTDRGWKRVEQMGRSFRWNECLIDGKDENTCLTDTSRIQQTEGVSNIRKDRLTDGRTG